MTLPIECLRFLWLMGFSLTISLQNKLRRAVPRRSLVFQVIRRSFILIMLGLILNSNKNMSTIAELRFPGVLQRIGITYLIVGLLEVTFTKRIEPEVSEMFYLISVIFNTNYLNSFEACPFQSTTHSRLNKIYSSFSCS